MRNGSSLQLMLHRGGPHRARRGCRVFRALGLEWVCIVIVHSEYLLMYYRYFVISASGLLLPSSGNGRCGMGASCVAVSILEFVIAYMSVAMGTYCVAASIFMPQFAVN